MVKVRTSQIPEDGGKPEYPNQRFRGKPLFEEVDFEDDDEEENETETKVFKTMISLGDFSIDLFGIYSIVKEMRFVEKPKAHFQHGITINKGVQLSVRFPLVDVSIWFENESFRDEKHAALMKALEDIGFNIIKV